MNGLLVRVGIDSTDGRWNAPVRCETGEFAYVPITEVAKQREGLETRFDPFKEVVEPFGVALPPPLLGSATHLDPDFDHLTYGDQGQRAKRIRTLQPGDFLAFYASLCPVDAPPRPFVYALIGFYIIAELVPTGSVPQERWGENAHTRRKPKANEILVRAKPNVSGRLRTCIPIGKLRNGSYRVELHLLEKWGDLDIKDGFIHRSAYLPGFKDAERFYRWFQARNPQLIPENNPRS